MNLPDIPSEVRENIERRANGASGGILRPLFERMGGAASAAAVYGTPIERDGVTIIPVASVRWGFGAGSGSGSGAEGNGSGEGGGGAGGATPIGFIEVRGGQVEFRPIHIQPPLWAIALLILAGGINAMLVLHGIRRLFRG
jgi:hypothetical protein